MASKLSQMDEVLREVANTIDNTTLLVVMGDHGMTSSGEHGGDSSHEVNSFLFTYTKKERAWKQSHSQVNNIRKQVKF